jgi:hypothetical protein
VQFDTCHRPHPLDREFVHLQHGQKDRRKNQCNHAAK